LRPRPVRINEQPANADIWRQRRRDREGSFIVCRLVFTLV
jgi:hypothetical protein